MMFVNKLRGSRLVGKRHAIVAAALTAVAAGSLTPSASATPYFWNPANAAPAAPSGGAGNWNIADSFWTDGTNANIPWPNLTTDLATFNGVGGAVVINGGNINANAVQFDVTGYTVSGFAPSTDTLTLDGATPTVTVTNASDTATISAIVAGSTAFSKAGAGTLVLSGSNTFTGPLTLSAGTLRATSSANALGTGTATLSLAGGTLQLANDTPLAFARNTTVTANSQITIDRLSGSGGVTHTLGTFSLGGQTLTVAPGTTISSGTAGLNIGVLSLTAATGATINTAAGSLTTIAGLTMGGRALTIGGAGDTTITTPNDVANTGTLIKNDAGTLTFTGDPNLSGSFTINGGALVLSGTGSTDAPFIVNTGATLRTTITNLLGDNHAITVNTGATLELGGSDTFGTLTGGGTVTNGGAAGVTATFGNNSAANFTFDGIFQNGTLAAQVLAVSKSGNNVATITGTNTYTGTTQVNSNTLTIAGPTASIAGSPTINVGDNNGGGEALVVGATADVVAGALNRLNDSAALTLNASAAGGFTMNGPALTSGGTTETIGVLTFSNGRNNLTLVPATGNEVQLTAASLARTNLGTGLIRGDALGGAAGTPDTSRLVFTAAPALTGGGGADGTVTRSVINFVVGDSSSTGPGSGFVTYNAGTGVRLLTAGEYDATIAGTGLRNVSTAGEVVSVSNTVNALRVTGGTTTIAAGQSLDVDAATLFTANGAIAGPGTLDFGSAEGIFAAAANTTAITATLGAQLSGTGGITFSSTGSASNVFLLTGNNTIVGNLTVNSGSLRVGSTGALNAGRPANVVVRPGAILQLNGFSPIIRDLATVSGSGTIQNGAATNSILTTYLTAAQNVGTVLSNGSTGTLGLVASGGQVLTLSAANTYTGATEVRIGTLQLSGSSTGTINASAAVAVNGGTLRLTNTSTSNSTARLLDAAPIALNGGTFDFDNNGSALNFSEVAGALSLNGGANTLTVDLGGSANTSTLTFASLTRTAGSGATLNLTSQSNGTANFTLGTTTRSRLVFTAAPTMVSGIIGGYATIDSSVNTREFAKYTTTPVVSATALLPGDYTTTLATGATPTLNIKITGSAALTGDTQINSLNVAQSTTPATPSTIDLGAGTLRVESGGVIVTGRANTVINNGTLTAGVGAGAAADLILHTLPFASSGLTFTNATDTIALANAVNGTPLVITGTAPGGLTAGVPYFVVNATATTVQVATTPTGIAVPITADGTTAALTELFTTTIGATIADNGAGATSFVKSGPGILVLSGTNTFTGRTTINQGTVRVSSDANLGAAPGTVVADQIRLSNGVLEVTTSFTLNANRGIGVGPGNNVISIASGATAGTGQILTYNGALTPLAVNLEGSVQFRSNVSAVSLGAGLIAGSLSSANVTGTLRFDATSGTFNITAPTTTIGRGLQVGMDGAAIVAFTSAGGSLTVGQGINETLDVGVNTSNAVNTVGTLNLSALSNFTSRTDLVRVGIPGAAATGQGTLLLAVNNDITAGTSFIVGDSGGPVQVGITSTLTFGAGVNNVTTRTFTVGGNKSRANATVAAGGTVNLDGFGANTLNMNVGVFNGTGSALSAANASTFNMTNGTLVASLNALVIGQITGTTAGGAAGSMALPGAGNAITTNSITVGNVSGQAAVATSSIPTTGTLNFGGGTLSVNNNVNLALFAGNTSTTIIPTSTGNLNLTGGTFTVGGNIGSNAAVNTNATSTVTLNGGTLDVTNGTISVDTFNAQSGTLQNLAGLFNETGTVTAPLNKTTAGTLTISGTSSYTSGTTVSAGTLLINGPLTSAANAVSINGGTVGGVGSIAGALTIGSAGGTAGASIAAVAPGNSVGTLIVSGAKAFNPDSIYNAEINSTAGTSDLLGGATGSLTILDGATLSVTDLGATLLPEGVRLPIIAYNGTLSGGGFFTMPGFGPIGDDSTQFTVGVNTFTLDYNSAGNTVDLVAIPEPATASLLAMVGMGLLARRRSRREA